MPLLLCLVCCAVAAQAQARTCLDAATDAEKRHGIPAGLLAAIGEVESGRKDDSGKIAPWPWTIDADGTSLFLPDLPAAVQALSTLQAKGAQKIDVGCFQVDLTYHPDAFASPAAGFDPDANAEAAARFLVDLHDRLGSWPAAVMSYHSSSPIFGMPYRDRVLARWNGGIADPAGDRATQPDPIQPEMLVLIPTTTALPHIILPDGTR